MGSETKQRISETATYIDLFERLLDPAFIIDATSYRILDANSASERFLNLSSEQITERSITEFVLSPSHPEFQQNLRIAKRRYYPRVFDSPWDNLAGTQSTMQISACTLKLKDESEVFQIIAKDVTQEREAENRIQVLIKDLQSVNAKLEELSTTDEMTKLNNFRHFKSRLAIEHERSERYGKTYAIIFCDVDNFKHYNDRNGHPAGDEVLRGVAKLIQATHRTTDFSARYGGEEFVVLCPETTDEEAVTVAERMRQIIEAHPFAHSKEQPLGKVSISAGVASFPHDGKTSADVLKAADEGVYYSKKNGRNRVTKYSMLKELGDAGKKSA